MAAVAKSGTPSLATVGPTDAHRLQGDLFAGEAIASGDACFIRNDGLVMRSQAVAGKSQVHGYCPLRAVAGDAVTLYHDVTFHYGSGLTPGAAYFLSATVPGGLDTATTATYGVNSIAFAVDSARIRVLWNPVAVQ